MYVIHVIQEIFGFDYGRYEYITINNKVQAGNKCQVRHVDSIMSTRGSHNVICHCFKALRAWWIFVLYLFIYITVLTYLYNHNYTLIILFDILAKINLKFLIFW